MSRFYKIFLYDFKMTLRQRESLFWMFLFPILLMVILGLIFGSSNRMKLSVGIVDQDDSVVSEAIVSGFNGMDGLVITTGSEEAERSALKDGKRNAVLIIPKGFGQNVLGGTTQSITMVLNNTNVNTAQITSNTMRGIVQQMGQMISGAPESVQLNEEVAQDVKDFKYIDFIVPGIIAMVVMFGGLAGYSLEIATYREKGILRRIRVSPLSLTSFLAGGIATVLIFTLIQTGILLIIGVLAFKMKIAGNLLYIGFLVIFGALSFLALGFLISSLTKNSRSAGAASQAIAMPMMFLAGVFFPLEIMPGALKVIAHCLPLYYLGDALRQVMINSASLVSVWLDILVLAGMGLVAFAAAVRFFRWE